MLSEGVILGGYSEKQETKQTTMKYTLKFFLTVMICISCVESNAQTFGVKGGLSLMNMMMKDESQNFKEFLKMKPGFHLGATVNIPLYRELLSLEPGIFLNMKGYTWKEDGSGDGYDWKTTEKVGAYYIDIPINVKAVLGGEKLKGYGIIGPFIGLGLAGNCKTIYEVTILNLTTSSTETEKIDWGKDEVDDFIKRLDVGVAVGAGAIYHNFTLGISYDLGLKNISSYTDDENKIKTRVLKISAGYLFGKK